MKSSRIIKKSSCFVLFIASIATLHFVNNIELIRENLVEVGSVDFVLHLDDQVIESNSIIRTESDGSLKTGFSDISNTSAFELEDAVVKTSRPYPDKPWLVIKSAKFNKERYEIDPETLDYSNSTYTRYDRVVITTKVHWPDQGDVERLKRMLCLLKAAYNRFVNYDILVFTTMPWSDGQVSELAKVVGPAKLTVSIDGPPLKEQLSYMNSEELKYLEDRCGVTNTTSALSWFHHCTEPNYPVVSNLAYAWQSEFRAYHIWNHPALIPYKWMIWMDSDALCTKTWYMDPMKLMIENNLTILFDNWPQGTTRGSLLPQMLHQVYNRSICSIRLDGNRLQARFCPFLKDQPLELHQIHGFHHITNLDVYRSEKHMKFLELMTQKNRFSRQWDDQLGVTIPAVMEDGGEKAWDLRSNGMKWMIRHNRKYDGKEVYDIARFYKWWIQKGRIEWPTGKMLCDDCLTEFKKN